MCRAAEPVRSTVPRSSPTPLRRKGIRPGIQHLFTGTRYLAGMRNYLFFLLLSVPLCTQAQLTYTAVGGYGVGITRNGALEVDPEAAYLGRVTVSGNVRGGWLQYNLGVEYGSDGWAERPAAQGGLSLVWVMPSGFLKASSAAQVTYRNIPWFISTDVNSFHMAIPAGDTWLYGWGIEPALVAARKLTSEFMLAGSLSYRFNYCKAYAPFGSLQSYSVLFVHLGLMYTRGKRYARP